MQVVTRDHGSVRELGGGAARSYSLRESDALARALVDGLVTVLQSRLRTTRLTRSHQWFQHDATDDGRRAAVNYR